MRVMWLVNSLMPAQAEKLGLAAGQTSGWVEGLHRALDTEGLQLMVCCVTDQVGETICFFGADGTEYALVPSACDLPSAFARLLSEWNPDLSHIFGSEQPHALAFISVCDPAKTLLQIQGLVSLCADHYFDGLPLSAQRPALPSKILNHLFGGKLMANEHRALIADGTREKQALRRVGHVLGHTTWDAACAAQLAPQAHYHRFGEILRTPFYSGNWQLETCQKYRLFVSQAYYPIKGLHMLLEVLPELVGCWPQTRLYIGGDVPIFKNTTFRRFFYENLFEYYGYLQKSIRRIGMEDRVTWLGVLNAQQMKQQYLDAHVFVSCSSMENESSSLSEAKILGVPSVASYVGGVADRIHHGFDGFHYPFEEPEMLRFFVEKIFSNDALSQGLSAEARKNAGWQNDPARVRDELLEIYRSISAG